MSTAVTRFRPHNGATGGWFSGQSCCGVGGWFVLCSWRLLLNALRTWRLSDGVLVLLLWLTRERIVQRIIVYLANPYLT
ncbi:hypothetical protein M011DRAFT_36903 [Sporormia fimetaria CBS 119925]|uniref:Uncharacterized protein n=1 Tax=Sporormia fimetaria CBS 119925 TaxID=1340428 RepID=A0A6A6VC38_9PLEO|nr:hypothetical protein M011DRAFT_36903 [Sporormia fimetaria CBS 119925]